MTVSVSTKHLMTGAAMIALVAVGGWRIHAQGGGQVQRNPCAECGTPTNDAPNPYKTIENFFKLPDGRAWGSTSLVDIDKNGKDIWAVDRCGANSCVSDPATGALNPEDIVFKFDGKSGAVLERFGGGMIVMPHGLYVDKDDNVWVTDNADNAPRTAPAAPPAAGAPRPAPQAPTPGAGATKGHQVFKFSPKGKLLMTLGKAGGSLTECCFQPNDVIVAPNGTIYVSQGHNDIGGPQVIWTVTKDGKPLSSFGKFGHERGEFDQPHALAFDSKGRLFVGALPSGHVLSIEAGRNATWDHSFPSGWHHVAAVRAKDRLKLYVDGKLVSESAALPAEAMDLSSEAKMQIGFGAQDYFKGNLADVRIYRGSLTPADIAGLTANESALSPSNSSEK